MLPYFSVNSILSYPHLLIHTQSAKKTFSGMAPDLGKSADSVRRLLSDCTVTKEKLIEIIAQECKDAKNITLAIDDTHIPKPYSEYIEGTGDHYNGGLHQRIRSYKVLVAAIIVADKTYPLDCNFIWGKEYKDQQKPSKNFLILSIIEKVKKVLAHAQLKVVMDGAFVNKEIIGLLIQKNISFEMRMHSNRTVIYKNNKTQIKNIKKLSPTQSHINHTIKANWNDYSLFITSHKRIDKNGKETIIYLVSNYKSEARNHVAQYKIRWNIEKMFRTCKQKLGFSDCASTKERTQLDHIFAVLLAYSLLQLERANNHCKTPEDAFRALRKLK